MGIATRHSEFTPENSIPLSSQSLMYAIAQTKCHFLPILNNINSGGFVKAPCIADEPNLWQSF